MTFPGKGKVAVLKTRPETVVEDTGRLMDLPGTKAALPQDRETILKVNVSWQTWYPACSSTPWQIEGVVRKLQADGYRNLSAAHNKTVVVDAYVAEKNNKHKDVVDKYGVRNVHLYEPEIQWVRYTPKAPMLVLDRIFPDGILMPEYFFDKNIIQLPDGQDARFHDHHGRDEECVRRAAQREAPLDARRHSRDGR
jgi:hypothetical protein